MKTPSYLPVGKHERASSKDNQKPRRRKEENGQVPGSNTTFLPWRHVPSVLAERMSWGKWNPSHCYFISTDTFSKTLTGHLLVRVHTLEPLQPGKPARPKGPGWPGLPWKQSKFQKGDKPTRPWGQAERVRKPRGGKREANLDSYLNINGYWNN